MHESEAEVLARIESTRAHMGETMEQIGDRVNPDRVQAELKARARDQVHEVKENVKYRARSAMRDMEHEVNEAGRGLWATIRENPIPAGMVGVGVAWLMANGRSGDHRDRDYAARYEPYAGQRGYRGYAGPEGTYSTRGYQTARGYTAGGYDYDAGYEAGDYEAGPMDQGFELREGADADRDMSDRARERMDDAAGTAKQKASDAADTAKHKASDAADSAKDRASEMKDQARHRASEMTDEARHRASRMAAGAKHQASNAADSVRHVGRHAQRAERRVEHAVQDNPLAAGAIAAALGLAAGLMIPETRREHEMFGPARDRMLDNAERTVRQAGEKARDVARETASESARQAVDQVMPGGGDSESMTEPRR